MKSIVSGLHRFARRSIILRHMQFMLFIFAPGLVPQDHVDQLGASQPEQPVWDDRRRRDHGQMAMAQLGRELSAWSRLQVQLLPRRGQCIFWRV